MQVAIRYQPLSVINCASGNKPGLGVMETPYIPHNHTLTVY